MCCISVLGSSFRARFRLGSDPDAIRGDREILLCPTHERECREVRDKGVGELVMTPEGHVYSRIWLDSLGFLVP